MTIQKVKLGKSSPATDANIKASQKHRSESERSQPGMKSIFKPGSFGGKTEQTLVRCTEYIFSINHPLQVILSHHFSS